MLVLLLIWSNDDERGRGASMLSSVGHNTDRRSEHAVRRVRDVLHANPNLDGPSFASPPRSAAFDSDGGNSLAPEEAPL